MLREVRSNLLGPIILPFEITITGGVPSVLSGVGDIITVTDVSLGRTQLTYKLGYGRGGLAFASRTGTSNTAGGYPYRVSGGDLANSQDFLTVDNGASLEDSNLNGFILNYNSSSQTIVKSQSVRCTRSGARIIGGKFLGSSATVSVGSKDFSITRTATGAYTIGFKNAFGNSNVVVLLTPIGTADIAHRIVTRNAAGCTITTFTGSTNAAADADFYLIVLGQDTRNLQGVGKSFVFNSQRKPRLVALQVDGSATPSILVNSAYGTVAESGSGTGDFTVTLRAPHVFARAPIIACLSDNRKPTVVSASASAVRVQTLTSGGGLADTGGTNILMLGSDDSSEY